MKKKFLIVLMVAAFFLAACEEQKVELLKEEKYSFENIEFKTMTYIHDRRVFVETNKETLVMKLDNVQFLKTEEPNTIVEAKWFYDPNEDEEYITSKIHVSESDIKKISRAYTDTYNVTMSFEVVEVKKNKEGE